MSTKAVRKINPSATGELTKVDIADRDGNGKVISAQYATKSDLTAAANSADSANSANTTEINDLKSRMTSAESGVSANATAISNEATARANAVSSEATARANADTANSDAIAAEATARGTAVSNEASARASADTALGGRIDSLTSRVDGIERTANGGSRSFIIDVSILGANNNDFTASDDTIDIFNGVGGNTPHIYKGVICPNGVLASGNTTDAVFVPEGLTTAQRNEVVAAVGNSAEIIELKLGDVILVKQTHLPDRWVSGYDSNNRYISFSRLEIAKLDIDQMETNINTLSNEINGASTGLKARMTAAETAINGKQAKLTSSDFDTQPTSGSTKLLKSGAVYTALQAKADTFTKDTTPTQNSTNPITSGAVYTGLAGKQDSLGLTSAIIGNLTIDD